MQKAINDQIIPPGEGVLHHAEGVDLIPANIELAGLEVSLVNCMNREKTPQPKGRYYNGIGAKLYHCDDKNYTVLI